MNKNFIIKYSFIFSFLFISCVGPPDPDHGLVENLPAIINTNTAFTFDLRGDNYTLDELFRLYIS